MKDNKNQTTPLEIIARQCECELDKTHPSECVDDRMLAKLNYGNLPEFVTSPELSHGPKMLGGAYSPFDIAVELAPEDIELDFDKVLEMTLSAFKDAGYVPGIHMDNHHDEKSEEELLALFQQVIGGEDIELDGCGYNGLVHNFDNPLGLSERSIAFHQKHPKRAARFIRAGVKVSVLGGNHAPKDKAYAVINCHSGKTIDSEKANQLASQTYDHDKEPFEEIIAALADNVDKIDKRWGENIRKDGIATYMNWYKVVGNILAGMDPVVI
jgi:hypothetical protein